MSLKRPFTPADINRLVEAGFELSEPLMATLRELPLIGAELEIAEEDDLSEMGVSMQWMSVDEILVEAFEAYPGLAACKHGFMPVGTCLEGSGDPYFIDLAHGAIVRIPHHAATGGSLDRTEIEVVAPSLETLLKHAGFAPLPRR